MASISVTARLNLPPPATGAVGLAEACAEVGALEKHHTPAPPASTSATRAPLLSLSLSLSLPPAAEASLAALGFSATSLLRREAALAVATASAALGAPLGEVDGGGGPARLLQGWGAAPGAPPPPPAAPPSARPRGRPRPTRPPCC